MKSIFKLALAALLTCGAAPESKARAAPTVVAGSPDAELRQAVAGQLSADPHLLATGIEVTASSGVVQLSGTVAASTGRSRAQRVAGVVRGVRAVVNRLRFVPVRRADAVLVDEIRRAIRGTAALARMPVAATVRDGVVELSGSISSLDQQQLAERVVLSIPGVRFCHNGLTSSSAVARTAAVVAADVQSNLDWDPLVQHALIRVTARGARVLLAGVTGSGLARRRAIALAWVKGVEEVDADQLVVDPTRAPSANVRDQFPTDAEISATIQQLAPLWPTVPMASLSISVVEGVATLRGSLQALAAKRAADAMVRSVVGVRKVQNEIRGPWSKVAPAPPPPPQRRRRNRR